MANRNRNLSDEEKIIGYAIQTGVKNLIEAHPIFEDSQSYIAEHIDQRGIQDTFEKAYNLEMSKNKHGNNTLKNREDALKTASKEVQSYIEGGSLLDEAGKKVILEEGLKEKKGGLRRLLHMESGGEKYLNNTIKTVRDLAKIMESGDYAERHKEIRGAIEQLQDAKFHYAAIRVLKEGGFYDDKEQEKYLKVIYNRAKEQPERIKSELEAKLAASIIGFFGVLLMIFNLNITGAVIGGDSTVTAGIVGVFLILLALLLFVRPLKKTFKK